MIMPSVSMRISPEAYKKVREIADRRNVTLVEAMDFLITDFELEIKDLKEQNEKLKEEIEILKKSKETGKITMNDVRKKLEEVGFFESFREIPSKELSKTKIEEIFESVFGRDINLRKEVW
jgi:FtsZ-binding cell division protein ZapB